MMMQQKPNTPEQKPNPPQQETNTPEVVVSNQNVVKIIVETKQEARQQQQQNIDPYGAIAGCLTLIILLPCLLALFDCGSNKGSKELAIDGVVTNVIANRQTGYYEVYAVIRNPTDKELKLSEVVFHFNDRYGKTLFRETVSFPSELSISPQKSTPVVVRVRPDNPNLPYVANIEVKAHCRLE